MQISEPEIRRRIKAAGAYVPPLELADQHAVMFNYRMALQVILILLERLEEKDKHIARLMKGNSDLSRLIEDWIVKNPRVRK